MGVQHPSNRNMPNDLVIDEPRDPWLHAIYDRDLNALKGLIAAHPQVLSVVSSEAMGRMTPLHVAAEEAWLPAIQALVPVSDPLARRIYGETAFMLALKSHVGPKQKMKALRALAPVSNLNQGDEDGLTPLGVATEDDDAHLVDFLLNHGADPKVKTREQSVMHDALLASDEVFDRLLPLSDMAATDRHGSNLLHSLLFCNLDDEPKAQRWVKLRVQGADPYHLDNNNVCAMNALKRQPDALQEAIHVATVEAERQALSSVLAEMPIPMVLAVPRSRL